MENQSPVPQEVDDRANRFVELFSRHEYRVKSYILALMPNWVDADDVFAETNIRLWKQFDEYESEKDFGAWACAIARFQILSRRSELTRERKILSDEFLDTVSEAMPGMLEQGDQLSRLRALMSCLEKLSDRNRRLLREVYAGDRTIANIAESLRQAPSAVSAKLYRLRGKLHQCVQSQLRSEGC